MSEEALEILHEVYNHLLKLLSKARLYVGELSCAFYRLDIEAGSVAII